MSANSFHSADIRWDGRGHPARVLGSFDLPATDDAGTEVGERVRQFLTANARELRLPGSTSLRETLVAETPIGVVLRYQQVLDGLPILGTEVVVVVDAQERVVDIGLDLQTRVDVAAAGDELLSSDRAQEEALRAVEAPVLRMATPPPQLAYFATRDGLRRSYLVLLATQEDPPHDWKIVVDAVTGDILDRQDVIKLIDGLGLVFDPNPIVTGADATLRDPDATVGGCGFAGSTRATIDAQRVARTLRDITLDPVTNLHRLEGPFVRIRNFGDPITAFPEKASATNFNYSSGDERFEAVNVYYHIDTFQRYLQDGTKGPGITTARNDQIHCDPHQGSGAAYYSPFDKGLHFSNSGPCRPDRAEDAHVMIHEYGHAIQDNQVPGWGGVNPVTGRDEAGAMGEGYGDAIACIYFAGHNFHREVFEPWIFGDIGGLRRVDGTKVYPTSWHFEVHDDGEIWSAALWNAYRAAGGDSMVAAEREAARDAIIKCVTLSHHLLTGTASMPDGAEAVMRTDATLDNYRGRHLMALLDSFHARGILACDPAANLEISDGMTFWNSPDLWIRNADDGGATHQEPEFGQDNYFYARVRNVGTTTARAFVVTFNVKPWAGTEFTYPYDFLPPISAACGFNLAPGASTVVKAKWPTALVPPTGTHACWLASVYTPADITPAGRHVWEHNNLAQKNLTVVDLKAGDMAIVAIQLGNLAWGIERTHRIEIIRPEVFSELKVQLVRPRWEVRRPPITPGAEKVIVPSGRQETPVVRFLEPALVELAPSASGAGQAVRLRLGSDSALLLGPTSSAVQDEDAAHTAVEADIAEGNDGVTVELHKGPVAGLPIGLHPRTPVTVDLRVTAPGDAKPGTTGDVHLVQRDAQGNIVGGVTVQIRIVDK